jgi:hypothetical protein
MEPDRPFHKPDHIEDRTDREVEVQVMTTLGSPPAAPADSFVLHAPLELMARAELLASVEPTQRDPARRRIVDIATEWTSRAPHTVMPLEPPSSSLPEAIAAGDVDEADRAFVALADHQSVDQFVEYAGSALLSHLGGAGHLCIFLDQLTRLPRPPHSAITAGRALIRDLARHPDWTLRWIDERSPTSGRPTHSFTDVLANPPSAGDLENNFIYPTMHLVDTNGMAAELLASPARNLSTDEARRQLLRVAAMSMLHDDPANAPYGWSHCLTMPQAALAVASRLADPQRAIAIAATYVLGFRATQSTATIEMDWEPTRPRTKDLLLETDTDDAVSQAWYTEHPDRVERELATFAATHHDAHLAKYTVACLHAAHDDPDAAPLFRAAATRLATWWRDHDAVT